MTKYAGMTFNGKIVPEPPKNYDKAMLAFCRDFLGEEMRACRICGWPHHTRYVCTKCRIDSDAPENKIADTLEKLEGKK